MASTYVQIIAGELQLSPAQVQATAALFDEGSTVPFIARYRKEATGSLDEVAITAIRDRLSQLADLDKRRDAMLESLTERELLDPALEKKLREADTLTRLEDIYLPFRPKRRTRAMIARERGLEPLAELLQDQAPETRPLDAAVDFVDPEKEVADVEAALAGARDIIAERISEDEQARLEMRAFYADAASIRCRVLRGKEEAGAKFRDYFEWSERASAAPSHRILAMRRGEKESVLSMRVLPEEDEALRRLERRFVKNNSQAADQVALALADGYKRLLSASMETEKRVELKQRADQEAIEVFAQNLRELLLAAPLGARRVLALDPGFRTGCKLVCLDAQGGLLHHDTIYPHTGRGGAEAAGEIVRELVKRHGIETLAVGNGTAGRETEAFLRALKLPGEIPVIMVNESGASIYSASEVARKEFPKHDITVRGAVSIGRRLLDPLAELVKLDAKSIGVGQYQHDVDQSALGRSLDDVVESCVNAVGVDVNTASEQLLTYVSGLGPQLAANIVAHRGTEGAFASRKALLKVPRLGPKAFEQAAGFLRVRDSKQALDASAVHPERYGLVATMAKDMSCKVDDLMSDPARRERIHVKDYVSDEVGLPTLRDILEELAKPGRDPRESFELFSFADGIDKMEDLEEGMRLPGIVTNVTDFGAFIDIGVHQDGLAHISQLADRFVKHPSDVVKVQQKVTATVLAVDLARKRISLSLKGQAPG